MTHLVFVYNANSGKLNAWLDSAHKIVSPSTYNCRLCALTYGIFKEEKEWIRFRESEKNTSFEFLHKDEFAKAYQSKWLPKYDLPAVFKSTSEQQLELIIGAPEMNELKSTKELIELVKKRAI